VYFLLKLRRLNISKAGSAMVAVLLNVAATKDISGKRKAAFVTNDIV
jgi:hypothetical protein